MHRLIYGILLQLKDQQKDLQKDIIQTKLPSSRRRCVYLLLQSQGWINGLGKGFTVNKFGFMYFFFFFFLSLLIRKTCPCNEYPLKPHFYIVKLGYAGVYLFFLFLLQNIDCGYSLEPPRRGGSKVYPQSMF